MFEWGQQPSNKTQMWEPTRASVCGFPTIQQWYRQIMQFECESDKPMFCIPDQKAGRWVQRQTRMPSDGV